MKRITIALIATATICSAQTYNESGGLVVMEMENTPSTLGLWQQQSSLAGYSGSGYLQFLGNTFESGPATSPLEYTFKINQAGLYYLHLHCAKEIHDGRTDVANDCYVRVEGDYNAGPGPYTSHGDNASLSLLQSDTKYYGGAANSWKWENGLNNLDPGGDTNKRNAVYDFKAGETYKLVVSGRSKFFRINRIVFRHTSSSSTTAQNLSTPESDTTGGGGSGYVYQATSDFPDTTGGAVPYYTDATRGALAIDASVTAYRGLFARASLTFGGTAGTYHATITSMGETDGECSYRLLVNGVQVGSSTNAATATDYELQTHMFPDVTIPAGAMIAVESNTHSNGLVLEDPGVPGVFAWARGRWTQLALSESSGMPGPDGPVTIPGRIEAEDYMFGGEGVGYHDTSAGNTGGDYRTDDVDVQICGEGGYNVGWTDAGEWLDYEISVPQTGTHDVTVRIATTKDGTSFKLQLDGSDLTAVTPVPNTTAWQTYTDLVIPGVSFPAGSHTLRLLVVAGTSAFNVNYIQVGAVVQPNTVTSLVLVDADTDQDIGPLNDGDTLYLSLLPTSNLNVRAETFPSMVGSVRFALDGTANYKTESVAPYALEGDLDGDYNPWTPTLGAHTLTATPFTEASGAGTAGTALTINFTVEATDPGLPDVDAGPGKVVTLPTNSVSLTGTATDNGTVVSTVWTQQSGPNTATLSGETTLNLGASGLVQGTYVFRLTATDDQSHSAYDEVNVNVVPEGGGVALITGELKRWHKVTFSWNGPSSSETATTNPFSDYRLDVVFSHAGSGKSYTVPGYYAADGDAAETSAISGDVWRAHFAPDEIGDWTYVVSFRTGSDIAIDTAAGAGVSGGFLDGDSGVFPIAATDKSGRDLRGKGRLQYVGQHHLRFAESGEYFLKAGADAPENFLAYDDFDATPNDQDHQPDRRKSWSPHAGDYDAATAAQFTWQGGKGSEILGAVCYLSQKGMNVFSFLTFSLDGDDDNVFPHRLKVSIPAYEAVADNARWAHSNGVYHDRFDVSKMAQWERVFEYSTRMGMYLHFKTQETENDQRMDGGALGRERKLYYRELVARFGHHLALNWNLGEENTNTDAQRKAFAQWFHDNDPYLHNVVLHTYPGQKGTVYTPMLGTNSKLTGLSLQTSQETFTEVFPDTLTWVQNSAASGTPWVVACDEPGDATHSLRPAGDEANSWIDGRKNALWGNVMAGGAGVEFYFGYNHDHSDLSCEDYRSRDGFWDYCRHMLEFFENNNVPFQDMTNANGLVSGSGNNANRCLAKAGEAYVVQLYNGGSHSLDLSAAAGDFEVWWYDPRNGGVLQQGSVTSVTAGSTVSLGTAPSASTSDWVVYVSNSAGGGGTTNGVMLGLANDADVRDDSVIVNLAADDLVPGRSGASGGFNRTSVFVFELPNLGVTDDPFIAATLSFNVESTSASPPGVDLYGLGGRILPDVLPGDYYGETAVPDPTDAALIQSNILHGSTGTGNINSSASSALAAYLNTQYDGGNGIGDHVFLRLTTNAPVSGLERHFITSTEGSAGNDSIRPQISYTALAPADFDTWLAMFTFAPGADTSPEGDPDGDGLDTWTEYLFGLDPSDGTSRSPIGVGLSKSAGTFGYTRRHPSLTGVTDYQVWVSEDLDNWIRDLSAVQTPDDAGAEIQEVEVMLTAQSPTPTRLFVKIAAE